MLMRICTVVLIVSRFGLAFQEAAQASGTRTRHDKFDASVVEVRKDDLAAFIQRIHIKL